MADSSAKLYEGMFLINQQAAAGEFTAALNHVQEILTRAGAEVVVLHRWDERRLAYPIKGQKRGLYIYALFNVEGVQIANIERDCNLSELVMRVMLLRAEHMGDVEIELAKREADVRQTEQQLHSESEEADEDAAGDSEDSDEAEEDALDSESEEEQPSEA